MSTECSVFPWNCVHTLSYVGHAVAESLVWASNCWHRIYMLYCLPLSMTPIWASWKCIHVFSLLSVGQWWKYMVRDYPAWSLTFLGLLLTRCCHSHLTSLAWQADWLWIHPDSVRQRLGRSYHCDVMSTGSFRNIWDHNSWHEHWYSHDR